MTLKIPVGVGWPGTPVATVDWAIGMQMTGTGSSEPVCAGDSGFDPQGAPVLPYGSTWRHYGFVCTAAPSGVTCRNPASHGWFMSARGWRRF